MQSHQAILNRREPADSRANNHRARTHDAASLLPHLEPIGAVGKAIQQSEQKHTQLLKRHQIAQDIDRSQWAEDYQEQNLVFAWENGAPIRPDYLTKALPRLAKQAGVAEIRFHSLRHASATYGLAAGEEMLKVSRRLGHSSITLTADTYSDTVPQRVERPSRRGALSDQGTRWS